ncbi:MAG: OsmC family protein [Bacteroidetes bacterium]|nr:OsmC family protein [Bacteroidota bacterium]
MSANEKIKTAIERVTKTLMQRPSFGLGTGISKTTITNGLTCEIQEGNWKFVADMPEQVGGNAAGPVPGVFGRAALGSCLAIGYMMRAAQLGISINALEVEVQADYDDGALFGTTPGTPPGYLEVRYSVTVDSDASEEDIMRVINEADQFSPYLDVFSRAQKCVRKIYLASQKSN